ncbi:hypothetical protein EYF80_004153 [Liparis tanakae]|uniref:Uncharacterized protein n=1 Tax=Liparis tanakae TaxID=230148 RepID=A0A4Z2J5S4_9TELE|nr:hypothetical protein EYF80_004153 [Liparis tanakae]
MFLLVCVSSTVKSPVSVKTYKGGSKEASMLEKPFQYLKGHICTSMASSVQSHRMQSHSGANPDRSEQSDLILWFIHGSLAHAGRVAETMWQCQRHKLPCNKTIAGRSHSPVQEEVNEEQRREGQRGRRRKPEIVTNTVVGSKTRRIESYWNRKRRECRKV